MRPVRVQAEPFHHVYGDAVNFGPKCRLTPCNRRACIYGGGLYCVAHAYHTRVGLEIAINRALAKQAGTLRTGSYKRTWAPHGHVPISERRKRREAHVRFVQQVEGRTPSREEVRS